MVIIEKNEVIHTRMTSGISIHEKHDLVDKVFVSGNKIIACSVGITAFH